MPQNFYELVWIFIIYAFLGWCTEVSYAALDTGKFVNRGFLNGPYCPVYGFGVVIVVMILTPLKDNLFLLFAGSFVLTTLLEYITGFILEKVFHDKWWDYSDKPFNIKGYVCLKFSIYWGLACIFIMDILHPMIYAVIQWIPFVAGAVVLTVIMCGFVVDCVITVSTILKFNKRLKIMDEMAASIHRLSNEIGINIYENVTGAIEKKEEFEETHAEWIDRIEETKDSLSELPQNAKARITETTEETKARIAQTTEETKTRIAQTTEETKARIAQTTEETKARIAGTAEETKARIAGTFEAKKNELDELMERYNKMYEEKSSGFLRLMKAFPEMKSRDNNDTLEKFKLHFKISGKDSDDKKEEK